MASAITARRNAIWRICGCGIHAGEGSTLTVLGNYLDQPDTQDPLGLTQEQLDQDPSQAGTGAEAFNTRKTIHHAQGGLVFDHNFSDDNSIRALGYYGTRQVVQYLANPSIAHHGLRRCRGPRSGLRWR